MTPPLKPKRLGAHTHFFRRVEHNGAMKRSALIALFAYLALGMAVADGPAVGKAAPAIAVKTVSGAKFELRTALKSGPVFLYFISTTCPVTKAATPHYVKLASAYRAAGVTVIGVVNADKKSTERWAKTSKFTFPVIADPDYKIIDSYKVERAPSSAIIGRDGKVAGFWTGYSRGFLNAAASASAKALGRAPLNLDFSSAPADAVAG
jgi:peroxiredoxin